MGELNPAKIVKRHQGQPAEHLFRFLLTQEPTPSDLIVFLQGDRLDRTRKVKLLYDLGFAKTILITGNNDLIGSGKRNEENDVDLSNLKRFLLVGGVPEESIFIDDSALNTLDQARNAIGFAKRRKFSSLLIVTSPFHALRVYLTFVKQALVQEWSGVAKIQCADLLWDTIPSGRGKSALELLEDEMEKIHSYASNLATFEEGERMLKVWNEVETPS